MPQDLNVALRIRADLQNAVRQLDRFERELKQTGRAGRQAGAGSRHAAVEMDRVGRAARRASGGVGLLRGAVAGIGFGLLAREATQLVRSLADTGLAYERLTQRFTFAAGGFREGAEEMQFVRDEAERLGLSFAAAAEGFTSLAASARGTALEGRAAREIFTSIAEAATVLQLSAEQTNGALTAIEQIISKGKVSAEELRGQLGERLPGAFQIAARAMGITTAELDEMLVAGELLADDFLPRFAAEVRRTFARDVADATDSAAAKFNRLGNAIEDLKDSIAQSGLLDWLADVATDLTTIVQLANQLPDQLSALAALGGDPSVPGGGLNRNQAAVARGLDTDTILGAGRGDLQDRLEVAQARLDEAEQRLAEAEERAARRPGIPGGRQAGAVGALRGEVGGLRAELAAIERLIEGEMELERFRRRRANQGAFRVEVTPLPDLDAIEKALETIGDVGEDARVRIQKSVLDAASFAEARGTDALNELNRIGREALAAARGNAEEEKRILAETAEARKLLERATANEIRDIKDKETAQRQREEKRAADRAEREAEREARAAERASKRQGDAARQVLQAVQDVNAELSGSTAYDRAVVSAERWREANLRSLREVGLAHGALAEAVENAFARMVAAAEEQSTVLGGVRGALRDYAREAAESGREARGAMERALRGMEDALTSFVQTGKLEFGDLVNSIVADLARLAIRATITGPLFGALGGALGLPVGVAHSGGVAGSLARQRTVDPRVFAFAPRYHEGGIAGLRPDEVPAILQRGETVLPRGASMPAFAPRIAIEFVNQGTPQREVSRDVRFDPEAMVVQIVVDNVENGGPIRNAVRRAATPGAI